MPVSEYVCPQCLHQLDIPIPGDSQPYGNKVRSTQDWGIVSFVCSMVTTGVQTCLRPFREGVDVKPAEEMQRLQEVVHTGPAEESMDYTAGADQRIWYSRNRPEGQLEHAEIAQPRVRAPQEQAPSSSRTFLPRSYFGWFIWITAVQAFTVVPLVWIIAVVVF
jgi:hypothetical protein